MCIECVCVVCRVYGYECVVYALYVDAPSCRRFLTAASIRSGVVEVWRTFHVLSKRPAFLLVDIIRCLLAVLIGHLYRLANRGFSLTAIG